MSKGRWFRFYDEALKDRKVQRLSPHLFKAWVNLLCLASKEGGKIPCDDDVAYELNLSVQDAAQQVQDLILAGLIDIDMRGQRFPHNWAERQYISDTSAARVRKHRENNKKKECNVTRNTNVTKKVTPPESESESESEADAESKFQPIEQVATRNKESAFDLGLRFGIRVSDELRVLMHQAEGFDLNVCELLEITMRARPQKIEGYFSTLCVNRIKTLLPNLDKKIIRAALNGKHEETKCVHGLLVLLQSSESTQMAST